MNELQVPDTSHCWHSCLLKICHCKCSYSLEPGWIMLSVIIRLINPSFRVTITVTHSKAAYLFIRKTALQVKLVSSFKLAGSFVLLGSLYAKQWIQFDGFQDRFSFIIVQRLLLSCLTICFLVWHGDYQHEILTVTASTFNLIL